MKCFLLILFSFLPIFSFSQDNNGDDDFEMDLFAEPEETQEGQVEAEQEPNTEAIPESKTKNPLLLLGDNLHGSLEARHKLNLASLKRDYSYNLTPKDDPHVFELGNQLKTYTGSDRCQINIDLSMALGSITEDYHFFIQDSNNLTLEYYLQKKDTQRRYISVNEFYGSLFFTYMDISLGKKIVTNGLSTLYSPSDIYSVYDAYDPFKRDPLGRYILEWSVYVGNLSLMAIVFPLYQYGTEPGPVSRWRYYDTLEALDFLGITPQDEKDLLAKEHPAVDISFENISYLLKLKSTFPGTDLFLSAFYGYNKNQVAQVFLNEAFQLDLRNSIVPVLQGASGFSSILGSWGLYGEALYNYSLESRDDDFLHYVAGMHYGLDGFSEVSLFTKMEWNLEYTGEWLITEQSHQDYQISSENQRLFKNDILIRWITSFKKDFELALLGQFDWKEMGQALHGGISYLGIENWEFILSGQYFSGEPDSPFYAWRNNARIISEIKYHY